MLPASNGTRRCRWGPSPARRSSWLSNMRAGREWHANGRQRPDLVPVDYKPVARYIQGAMLTRQCQLYVDGIPARTRRRENKGGAAHTGLPWEAVGVIDG